MTVDFTTKRRVDTRLIAMLLIAALGIAGVVGFYVLRPGVQFIELVLLIIAVGIVAIGYRRGIVRGIMTILFLYVATGLAATFYPIPAPYVAGFRSMFAGNLVGGKLDTASVSVDGDSLAISFILLMLVVWIVLEAIGHSTSPDTSLPKLGFLDNLGGVAVHLVIAALVASLLFNALGYGHLRSVHNKALLRSRFNQVLYLHYSVQSFWFGETPPPLYVYDLDISREP